jgi:hypothetical protein
MMKVSIRRSGSFSAISRKAVVAIALTAAIGSLSVSSALADERDHHDDHNRHERRDRHDDHDRRPYGYARPVYVPPPVYSQPRQSPGISLFLPFNLRR